METANEKLAFIESFKKDLKELISYESFEKGLGLEVLRAYFQFYSKKEYYIKGLNFFCNFPEIIKANKFNSLKAYLFFFAYQTKKFGSPLVKELLSQELIHAEITDGDVYLEFCLYCFFKGLYYIEKRNFFMATYLYCSAVQMGLHNPSEDLYVFNEFSFQMIRALCFLKGLSDFDITNYLFRKKSEYSKIYEDKIKEGNISDCLNYLRKDKISLISFENFVKSNKDIYENHKLNGLKKEAEEMLILKKIKEEIKIYKRILLTKLAQNTGIDFKDLMRIIQKKCMEGDLNLKYDQETNIIEVFNADPGKKENVKKNQQLYKNIIEGNKNYFISLRDKKLEELNNEGKINPNMINIDMMNNMIHHNNHFEDDDNDD